MGRERYPLEVLPYLSSNSVSSGAQIKAYICGKSGKEQSSFLSASEIVKAERKYTLYAGGKNQAP